MIISAEICVVTDETNIRVIVIYQSIQHLCGLPDLTFANSIRGGLEITTTNSNYDRISEDH